jgi:hypothetical protein
MAFRAGEGECVEAASYLSNKKRQARRLALKNGQQGEGLVAHPSTSDDAGKPSGAGAKKEHGGWLGNRGSDELALIVFFYCFSI